MTFIVAGANSDFGKDGGFSVQDALYNYLVNKWGLHSPHIFNETILEATNKQWDGFGQYHMYVQSVRAHGNRHSEPVGWIRVSNILRVHLIMKRLSMGEIPIEMDEAAGEVERLTVEYSPYWIAGIDFFDDWDITHQEEPTDNPAHPFNNTWHITIDVTAYYTKASDFQIDIAPYDPSLHAAGTLTYL